MSAAKIVFPSSSNAFTAVKSTSLRRDSIQAGVDRNGVKRIKLSFPAATPRPVFDRDQASQTLISAFPVILSDRPLPAGTTLESLYRLCQSIVMTPPKPAEGSTTASVAAKTQQLFSQIYHEADGALKSSATTVGKELKGSVMSGDKSTKGTTFLRTLLDAWTSWEIRSIRLNSILLHLDRTYVLQTEDLASLRELSLRAFRMGVLEEKLVQERYLQAVMDWADSDRRLHDASSDDRPASRSELEQIEHNVVQTFINFAIQLDASDSLASTYLSRFEAYYVEQVALRDPSKTSIENAVRPYATYIAWVVEKLEQEQNRCENLFASKTLRDGSVIEGKGDEVWAVVHKAFQKDIVRESVLGMAQLVLDEAMNASDAETLQRLYTLLVGIGSFGEFRKALSRHVKDRATKLISDPANDATMIATLLKFKGFCETTVNALCGTGEKGSAPADTSSKGARRKLALETEIRDGIKAGVETRQATPAELIAKHLDQTMRKGQGSMSAEAFEKVLNDIVDLVKFTKDKDVFKEFYITQLAKRLLLGRSASTEEEINMVKKLQIEYGEEFTTGDAMMKDLTQSEDMNKKYQELRMSTGKEPTNLTVNVLSQGQWPPYKQLGKGWENFRLTSNMQRELDGFEAWYKHTFSGRVLTWRHQHTSVTMTAKFPGGNKEIGVSLFQASVLEQFNGADTLTFEEIFAQTGIERDELVRTLQSLYAMKVTRVLIKRPPGKEVKPTDTFTYNSGFTRDKVRFKINQLQQDLSAEESKQTSEKVFEDRNLTLDAQIVRIMKSKKQVKMQDLINEVIEAVKKLFHPEVKAIKAQVDSLIEREYLERNEEHRDVLTYLA